MRGKKQRKEGSSGKQWEAVGKRGKQRYKEGSRGKIMILDDKNALV